MSYPQAVPDGWTKGEPVRSWGAGSRHYIGRDRSCLDPVRRDEFLITFDSREDAESWLKWWKS